MRQEDFAFVLETDGRGRRGRRRTSWAKVNALFKIENIAAVGLSVGEILEAP
jgi:hypothetical protein